MYLDSVAAVVAEGHNTGDDKNMSLVKFYTENAVEIVGMQSMCALRHH